MIGLQVGRVIHIFCKLVLNCVYMLIKLLPCPHLPPATQETATVAWLTTPMYSAPLEYK